MQVPIKVKSPNNIGKWQMGFNSAFKGLTVRKTSVCHTAYISVFPYDLHNKQQPGRHTELTGWSL
jgi:hypothetical protein